MPHVANEHERTHCLWCGCPIEPGDWLYGDGYCSKTCEENQHNKTMKWLREGRPLEAPPGERFRDHVPHYHYYREL